MESRFRIVGADPNSVDENIIADYLESILLAAGTQAKLPETLIEKPARSSIGTSAVRAAMANRDRLIASGLPSQQR